MDKSLDLEIAKETVVHVQTTVTAYFEVISYCCCPAGKNRWFAHATLILLTCSILQYHKLVAIRVSTISQITKNKRAPSGKIVCNSRVIGPFAHIGLMWIYSPVSGVS